MTNTITRTYHITTSMLQPINMDIIIKHNVYYTLQYAVQKTHTRVRKGGGRHCIRGKEANIRYKATPPMYKMTETPWHINPKVTCKIVLTT